MGLNRKENIMISVIKTDEDACPDSEEKDMEGKIVFLHKIIGKDSIVILHYYPEKDWVELDQKLEDLCHDFRHTWEICPIKYAKYLNVLDLEIVAKAAARHDDAFQAMKFIINRFKGRTDLMFHIMIFSPAKDHVLKKTIDDLDK